MAHNTQNAGMYGTHDTLARMARMAQILIMRAMCATCAKWTWHVFLHGEAIESHREAIPRYVPRVPTDYVNVLGTLFGALGGLSLARRNRARGRLWPGFRCGPKTERECRCAPGSVQGAPLHCAVCDANGLRGAGPRVGMGRKRVGGRGLQTKEIVRNMRERA